MCDRNSCLNFYPGEVYGYGMKSFYQIALLLFTTLTVDAQVGIFNYTGGPPHWHLDTLHSKAPMLHCDSIVATSSSESSYYGWNDEIDLLAETDSTLVFSITIKPCEADVGYISFSYNLDKNGILRVNTSALGRIVQGPRMYSATVYFTKTESFSPSKLTGISFEGDTSIVTLKRASGN